MPFQTINSSFLTNVRGLWAFDGDLTDSSGNSFDLTAQAGTPRFAEIDGLPCVYLSLATVLERTIHDALLAIPGDVTIPILVHATTPTAAGDQILVAFGDPATSELEADNVLYRVGLDQTTSEVEYFAEEGAGTDITHSHEVGMPIGGWHLVTIVRSSNDVILYIDGYQAGLDSSGLNVPTGGGSATLTDIGVNFDGYLGGLAIAASAATAEEVASLWAWVSNGGDSTRIYDLDGDLVPNLRGLWNFNDTLADEGPFGLDLQWSGLTTHDIRYASIQGKRCVYFQEDGDHKLNRASNDLALTIKGALTLHCLYYLQREPTASFSFVRFQENTGSEAEVDNEPWGLLCGVTAGTSSREFRYFAETGGGTNLDFTFQAGIPWAGWHLATLVRDADGDVVLYLDGVLSGTGSSGFSSPTGGTNSRLRIGAGNYGFMGGLLLAAHESSAAEVADMWAVVTGEATSSKEQVAYYRMRAFENNTVVGYVTWISEGAPDFVGTESPYNPGDLSDFTLMGQFVGDAT